MEKCFLHLVLKYHYHIVILVCFSISLCKQKKQMPSHICCHQTGFWKIIRNFIFTYIPVNRRKILFILLLFIAKANAFFLSWIQHIYIHPQRKGKEVVTTNLWIHCTCVRKKVNCFLANRKIYISKTLHTSLRIGKMVSLCIKILEKQTIGSFKRCLHAKKEK